MEFWSLLYSKLFVFSEKYGDTLLYTNGKNTFSSMNYKWKFILIFICIRVNKVHFGSRRKCGLEAPMIIKLRMQLQLIIRNQEHFVKTSFILPSPQTHAIADADQETWHAGSQTRQTLQGKRYGQKVLPSAGTPFPLLALFVLTEGGQWLT